MPISEVFKFIAFPFDTIVWVLLTSFLLYEMFCLMDHFMYLFCLDCQSLKMYIPSKSSKDLFKLILRVQVSKPNCLEFERRYR